MSLARPRCFEHLEIEALAAADLYRVEADTAPIPLPTNMPGKAAGDTQVLEPMLMWEDLKKAPGLGWDS